jgi:hypothetical protein
VRPGFLAKHLSRPDLASQFHSNMIRSHVFFRRLLIIFPRARVFLPHRWPLSFLQGLEGSIIALSKGFHVASFVGMRGETFLEVGSSEETEFVMAVK